LSTICIYRIVLIILLLLFDETLNCFSAVQINVIVFFLVEYQQYSYPDNEQRYC